jgi:hypothetical protein
MISLPLKRGHFDICFPSTLSKPFMAPTKKNTPKSAPVTSKPVISLPTLSRVFDGQPLFTDNEIIINDEQKLVEWTAHILLGYHTHVTRILQSGTAIVFHSPQKKTITSFIRRFKKIDREKRHGWLFQTISWLALKADHPTASFKMQPPHDAPAQHGIDGLGLLLDNNNTVQSVVITEDKCTENPRDQIRNAVWPEFRKFERGENDQKLVSRLSALLESLPDETLRSVQEDIYRLDLRKYRVGITRTSAHSDSARRKALFKDYDQCVPGALSKRTAASFEQEDIRDWMDRFSEKIINYLEGI